MGKESKGAKIRNQYNQVPHLTQDTNRKVTNSQLDTTNESQELIFQPLYVHLKDRKPGGGKLMFMPFKIVSICVWLWLLFSDTRRTAAYSHLHK